MPAGSIPPTALPRARALTSALIEPVTTPISFEEILGLRKWLEPELRSAAGPLTADRHIRVDAYFLRVAGRKGDQDEPFEWGPWTARRQIGLDGVRGWFANPRSTPSEAVHEAVVRLAGRDGENARRGSLGHWLAKLDLGARCVAEAEAVTWATQLIGALDWTHLTHPVIGGDRSIVFESLPQLMLRGRVEIRTGVLPSGSSPDESCGLLVMMTGHPSPTARDELGLAALTLALDRQVPVPGRVVGWWPQSGRAVVHPIDMALLESTGQSVVTALREATKMNRARSRVPRQAAPRRTTVAIGADPAAEVDHIRFAS